MTDAGAAAAAVPAGFAEAADLLPTYDRAGVGIGIAHFGVGGFHRSHEAMYVDRVLRAGGGDAMGWGICGIGVRAADARMRDALDSQDGLYTLVLKHPDGQWEASVVGSIRRFLYAPDDPGAVLDVLTAPTTRIVSLTVTEGGYGIDDETGEYRTDGEDVRHDAADPDHPVTAFGCIVRALRLRRDAGVPAFTVMSCDNLPGNGNVARKAIVSHAAMTDDELAAWIDANVAFPNSMVDRITPVTTPEDIEDVRERFGIEDAWPVVAEPFVQWVLEDHFTDGRPDFGSVGVQLVDDVVPYELMKLRMLNASHQSLGHWGRLLDLEFAHDASDDADIQAFTRAYLEREARPTLRPVPGIDLVNYVDTLFERFSNPAIADMLARLAEDASDRVPKFVLPAVRDNAASGGPVELGAAICGAWALGMEGRADDGSEIVVKDRMWDVMAPLIERQKAGDDVAFLECEPVFGTLGTDARFREAFVAALRGIRSEGARGYLRTAVREG